MKGALARRNKYLCGVFNLPEELERNKKYVFCEARYLNWSEWVIMTEVHSNGSTRGKHYPMSKPFAYTYFSPQYPLKPNACN